MDGIIIPKTKFHKIMERVNLTLFLCFLLSFGVAMVFLPERIPMHFNAAGDITREGSKYELIIVLVLEIIINGILALVTRYPSIWNTPCTVNKENQEMAYQLTKDLLLWLQVCMQTIFILIIAGVAFPNSNAIMFLWGVTGFIVILLVYYIVRLIHLNKKSNEVK